MNTRSLDIRILRSLQSVSETGNMTESARRLWRTQPAITLQLQRLEDICGFNLFRNEGRKMLLLLQQAERYALAGVFLARRDVPIRLFISGTAFADSRGSTQIPVR